MEDLRDDDLTSEFRCLLEEMAEFARSRQIAVSPYISPQLQHYSALPPRQRSAVTKGLKAYYEAMKVAHAPGAPLSVAASVETMLRKLNLKCDQDYPQTLSNDHVVEIYRIEHLQVYRSLHFARRDLHPRVV
jgi:hypothetical protein